MIISNKQMTKVLIRLRGCAGCTGTLLFANPRRQVFFRRDPTKTFLTCMLRYHILVVWAIRRVVEEQWF